MDFRLISIRISRNSFLWHDWGKSYLMQNPIRISGLDSRATFYSFTIHHIQSRSAVWELICFDRFWTSTRSKIFIFTYFSKIKILWLGVPRRSYLGHLTYSVVYLRCVWMATNRTVQCIQCILKRKCADGPVYPVQICWLKIQFCDQNKL